jgi:uncharacterized protein DUF3592
MKSMVWLGAFFIVLGIVALAVGAISYSHEKTLLSTYESATATVVDWIPDPNYGTPDYCPVYEYTTSSGESRSYTGDDCVGKPDPQTVGQQQEVIYYDPQNPYTDVQTKGFSGSEGTPLIAGAIGFGFFVLLGLLMIFVNSVLGRTGNSRRAAQQDTSLASEAAQARANAERGPRRGADAGEAEDGDAGAK